MIGKGLRSVEHAFLWSTPLSHGGAYLIAPQATHSKIAAIPKTHSFRSESMVIFGNIPISEASEAPNPSVTKSAGIAQHTKVLSDPKSARSEKIRARIPT